jgi:LPXTG-site transpeptidase (sortase) family protein
LAAITRVKVRSYKGLWLIGIGFLIYAFGFSRLVGSALDEPSPIDQVDVPPDSELGFVPYLVSDEPVQDDQIAPAIVLNSQEITQALSVQNTDMDFVVNRLREEYLSGADEGILKGEVEAPSIWLPSKLIIPKIQLEAPIEAVTFKSVELDGKTYEQWFAPDSQTVGWHETSAQLGVQGNTILNGHHNIFGEVFRDLSKLEVGDRIMIQSGERVFDYIVGTKLIVPERYQTIETRLENARWIQPSNDERITLVTCWPYESNTHRVIVVAVPVEAEGVRDLRDYKELE